MKPDRARNVGQRRGFSSNETWDVNMFSPGLLVLRDGNGWEWRNGIIDSYCGSFPHSLLSTKLERLSKQIEINDAT